QVCDRARSRRALTRLALAARPPIIADRIPSRLTIVSKESKMVAAVRVHKPGGPEVLTYEDVQIAAPGQGQIKIKQHAAGVNFIDAYFRMGLYPAPVGMPFIAGNESAVDV